MRRSGVKWPGEERAGGVGKPAPGPGNGSAGEKAPRSLSRGDSEVSPVPVRKESLQAQQPRAVVQTGAACPSAFPRVWAHLPAPPAGLLVLSARQGSSGLSRSRRAFGCPFSGDRPARAGWARSGGSARVPCSSVLPAACAGSDGHVRRAAELVGLCGRAP